MKRIIICAVLAMAVFAAGCSKDEKPLHVGSKQYSEQLVLGEIVARLAENAGVPVSRSIPYGDGFLNLEAVKRGDLDIYPEYNGTGLVNLGQPAIADGDKALATVRRLYKPLGLEWLNRLGFANNYEIVMRSDRAATLEINTISDLTKLPDGIRFVARKGWVERPSDGLSALLRRFGLRQKRVTELDSAEQVYHELLVNNADVAIGFSTDGQIADYGLTILQDDLNFFPVYEASFLVRADSLARFPALRPALEKLAGAIDTETMQEMNRQVDMEGQDPAAVANTFLVKAGLIPKGEIVTISAAKELVLAVGMEDELGGLGGKALRAVRKAYPKRRAVIKRTPNPVQAVNRGEARIGFVGTESFFELIEKKELPGLNTSIEGLAVVGHRYLHILTGAESDIQEFAQAKKVGVGSSGGSSHRIAKILSSGLELEDKIEISTGSIPDQLEDLRGGGLDAVLFMAAVGHEKLTMEMAKGGLRLVSLENWQEGNAVMRFPFLRLARIPQGTYREQDTPIETLSSQTVLLGPASREMTGSGDSGPMGGVVSTQPVTDNVILALNEELSVDERIDPTIQSAAVLSPKKEIAFKGIQTDYAASVANLLVLLAVIYLLYLFLLEDPSLKRKKGKKS